MTKTSPFRLERLEIRDFRGIDHLEIDLPTDGDGGSTLVLAGANGSGKTSVLEAVLLLLGRIDLLPRDTAPPHELIHWGAKDFVIRGTFTRKGRGPTRAHVNAESVERFAERFEARPARGGVDPHGAIKRALAATLREAKIRAPSPMQYAVESFSARREPEQLGVPTSPERVTLGRHEERRISEIQRRLGNAYARSGHDVVFERIEQFMRPFFGNAWHLDVLFRSA